MKKFALLLVLFSSFLWAIPAPDDYPVKVHVTSSHVDLLPYHGWDDFIGRRDILPLRGTRINANGYSYGLPP
jgi:hypothetical protein